MSNQPYKKWVLEFGHNVRRERNACNMTLEKLAELTDLNIRTVQKIERGEITILITTAIRVQRALRCDWEKLFALSKTI